ncbi:hypothetical protein BHF71_09635 [Vulcanibacillus modesticaldus]|uniref:GP-PDE domain-containing protein n=1 Tax=Vulcanibacillus modesticaldus TaxID=337097 RepID=A0A1D2YU10_9BACI|nr:glycerophosphodiester phosphodiesterase [Vulcanibacillus modesticaldus]OEF99200.1 hypothetical protein BHF71_09635 [Vulcanibacillus modesticaldus]
MKKFLVIAHRGASAISPENTMIAFKRAIDIGVNAIETDVQMTKDGQLILIHDEKLDRTTNGMGFVKDLTLEEIRNLDAGSWFSSEYQGEKIPTLDEFFQLVKPTTLFINLEIKMGFVMYPGLEEKIVQKIKEYDMEKRVTISSFNHYSIALVKRIAPELNTAVLYTEGLYQPWEYAKFIGATALHPYKEVVYSDIVRGAHQSGMKVFPYTVDDKKEMLSMIEMGVDGLITNVPDRLLLLLREL